MSTLSGHPTERAGKFPDAAGEVSALARDAARYRYLRELPHIEAQALFWNFISRKQRDQAIDAAIAAAPTEV